MAIVAIGNGWERLRVRVLRWATEAPVDNWEGMMTNEGRVHRIQLVDKYNLRGNLPPKLGQLTNLTTLDLRYNNFSGNLATPCLSSAS